MSDLKKIYLDEIAPKLKVELGLGNIMEVPKITKITLNMGVGEASADRKAMEGALSDMTAISGQKPLVTNARKSVAECVEESVLFSFPATTSSTTWNYCLPPDPRR